MEVTTLQAQALCSRVEKVNRHSRGLRCYHDTCSRRTVRASRRAPYLSPRLGTI